MTQSGERGPTGDHGQHGDHGDIGIEGAAGPKGDPGVRGSLGLPGIRGERGPLGDHGQHGDAGETGGTGDTGERGVQGPRGRGFSRLQTIVIFLFVALVFIVQTYVFNAQKQEIVRNAHAADVTRYESCVGGLTIIEHFNAQQEALARIEETQTIDPKLAQSRIDAYRGGKIAYDPRSCGIAP